MTDSPPADSDLAGDSYPVELRPSEVALLRTALRLLLSTLGHEEADDLAEVKDLLAKLPDEPVTWTR
jgi:hypothetical protein